MESRKSIGSLGEEVAGIFLKKKGYTILEKNYRKPWGEIDIVAEKGGIVRFVEVKTLSWEGMNNFSRESDGYFPEEQIHPHKLQKIARTAELYMSSKGDKREFQIDAVGVFMDTKHRKARCRLWEQVL